MNPDNLKYAKNGAFCRNLFGVQLEIKIKIKLTVLFYFILRDRSTEKRENKRMLKVF